MDEDAAFDPDAPAGEEPSRIEEALGSVAVVLGALGCGAVMYGVIMSEGMFLGGGALSMLALLVGYLGWIRSRAARSLLLVGLLGLIVAGVSNSEAPGYVGFAVSLVALLLGCFGGCNRGQVRTGVLLGLLGTLACLGILAQQLMHPQYADRPRPGVAETPGLVEPESHRSE